MTRQQAIAAASQTRKSYWTNIVLYTGMEALFAFMLSKVQVSHSAVWILYVLLPLLTLTSLQSAERLAFPVRTALRSRALNIKFGRRISAISFHLARAMFVAAICALAYHLVTQHSLTLKLANSLIFSGALLTVFTHDLLGHKFQDSDDHFEHSPPLTGLKPLQSEHWSAPHAS
jgi:hypothetical protein